MNEMEEDLFKGIVRNSRRLIILWLINHSSYSGYNILNEMKKIAGQDFGPGVIYPVLNELEEGEYIAGNKVQKGRRHITYYFITEKGKKLLDRLRSLFTQPIGSVLQEILGEKFK